MPDDRPAHVKVADATQNLGVSALPKDYMPDCPGGAAELTVVEVDAKLQQGK